MTTKMNTLRRGSSRSRAAAALVAVLLVAVLLGFGGVLVAAQPASAATAICTAFGRDSPASYLSGSCKGNNSSGVFTVKWQCSQWDTVRSKTFGGSGFGASFRFKACNSTVYSAWTVTGS